MPPVFRVETDRVVLLWDDHGDTPPAPVPGTSAPGQLIVTARRGQPVAIQIGDAPAPSGAPLYLFEQRDYTLSASVKPPARAIEIAHRDPNVTHALRSPFPTSVFGKINFGGQIGRSELTVLVDGEPELEVAFDVFPTKLDYATDYEQLLADLQSVLTGLVLEHLRATYQLGVAFHAPRPTELEWMLLLRHVAGDLERALGKIAARPVRGLTRELRLVSATRTRRIDAALRSAIRRGRGRGTSVPLDEGGAVRARVAQRVSRTTHDTLEHRWFAEQLRQCRRKVGDLLRDARARPVNRRRTQLIAELAALERQLARLSRLELFTGVTAPAPPGFASLQLTGAPGYRTAYRCCMALRLGLRIEGGPFQLSLKDVGDLYEYWCYVSVLQIVAEETGARLSARDLVVVQRTGIRVDLARGRTTRVAFRPSDADPAQVDREIVVTFNPRFAGGDMLIAQQPDILVTLRERDWPAMHLVLDAKYRVDASEKYLAANDVPGPPQDAINVLHRYRDAIIDRAADDGPRDPRDTGARPWRSVVEAVALFPSASSAEAFRASRLWQAIDRISIGAIPLLPGNDALLREWLRNALRRGGWALSDRAPRHAAAERAHEWQRDAVQPLLIGVLRGEDPAAHLAWIRGKQLYYLPKVKDQRRQLQVAKLALYVPAGVLAAGRPGAVEYVADVLSCDVVPRRQIATPWSASDRDQLQVLYRLGPVEARTPIINGPAGGRGERVSSHRWSSALALGRARELRELLLETEPEWRLLEALRAGGAVVELEPERPRPLDPENPEGRTWLVVGQRRARYAGASGFALIAADGAVSYVPRAAEACAFLIRP